MIATSIKRYVKPETRERARVARKNQTPSETRLWSRLRCRKQGFKVRRQAIIRGYIVDFYAPQEKLIIEVDGPSHQTSEGKDTKRTGVIEALGFRVIRFTNDQVWKELDMVLARIREAAQVCPKVSP